MLTVEEMNLIAVFELKTRDEAIREISHVILRVEDKELKEMCNRLIAKLKAMTDAEYMELNYWTYLEDVDYGE